MQLFKIIHALRCALAPLLFGSLLCSQQAHAQIRLPRVDLPVQQRLNPLDTSLLRPANQLLANEELKDVLAQPGLRLIKIKELLNLHKDVLDLDPRGAPVVRHEILAWSPSILGIDAALSAGLSVIREQKFEEMDQTLLVLSVPATADTAAVLETLRSMDPQGTYDFNHIYTGSAAEVSPLTEGISAATAPETPVAPAVKNDAVTPLRVGLIDSGVDPRHLVFRHVELRQWGCDGTSHPAPHGTAVAALMVGQSTRFKGVLPGAGLYAADIYCDAATGGSADKIAGALGWLSKQRVGVINLSLVGPANRTLEKMVDTMLARGHILVAAVGNDGPAASPLYPASYAGVVGVSAVDAQGKVLPEAARGPQVMFAAPGSQMVSASIGAPPYRTVRGTSFAAPIVAALLAGMHSRPDRLAANNAITLLAKQARLANPADAAVLSNETGYGVVGADYRVDPRQFH
jgi:hypothetical protein